MTAVSNQESKPFEPVKISVPTKEVSPFLQKLVQRVALVVAFVFLGMFAGGTISIFNFGWSVGTGIIVSGVLSVFLATLGVSFLHLPSNFIQYRLEVLDEIKKRTSNERALNALNSLRELLQYPLDRLERNSDVHHLYRHLLAAGDGIDIHRKDLREAWTDFLNHLHAKSVQTPDKQSTLLNGVIMVDYFNRHRIKPDYQWIDSWSTTFESDLEQVARIGKLSFGEKQYFTADRLRHVFETDKSAKLMIARHPKSGKVVGYGFYYIENGVVRIPEIAREPEMAGYKMGMTILEQILQDIKWGIPVHLVVRPNDPFRATLNAFGVIPTKYVENYFESPPIEKGLFLELNWEERQKRLSQQR